MLWACRAPRAPVVALAAGDGKPAGGRGNGGHPASTLKRHLLQFQPLHRRRLEALDVLAHAIHVRSRVGDDARYRFVDDPLELEEELFALGLIVGLARSVEQLIDAAVRVQPELAIPASSGMIEGIERGIDGRSREVA